MHTKKIIQVTYGDRKKGDVKITNYSFIIIIWVQIKGNSENFNKQGVFGWATLFSESLHKHMDGKFGLLEKSDPKQTIQENGHFFLS